jgi:hypothetical protein
VLCFECTCLCLQPARQNLPMPVLYATSLEELQIHQHFFVPSLPWMLIRGVRLGFRLVYYYARTDQLFGTHQMLRIRIDSFRLQEIEGSTRIQEVNSRIVFLPRSSILTP